MPVEKCTKDGVAGYKAGPNMPCITGEDSRGRAERQLAAIEAEGAKEREMTTETPTAEQLVPEGTRVPADSPLAQAVKAAAETEPEQGEKGFGIDQVMPAPMFAGGATSFEELDQFTEAAEVEGAVSSEMANYQMLVDNVMRSPELEADEKAERVATLSTQAAPRIRRAQQDAVLQSDVREFAVGEKQETKTVSGVALGRKDFADQGDPERPSTWKLPLTDSPGGAPTTGRVGDAITALQPGGFRGNPVSLTEERSTVIGRIRSAVGRLPEGERERLRERVDSLRGAKALDDDDVDPGYFTAFKDTTGAWRWVALHSNNYEDRHGQTFAEAGHKAFVDYVDATADFPVLRLWHLPLDVGLADVVDYDDGFMVSSGTFGPEHAALAEALSGRKDLGCSHGYLYRRSDLRDGVFHGYRSFEVTVLPRSAAANELSAFIAAQEIPSMNPAKAAFLNEMDPSGKLVETVESGVAHFNRVAAEKGVGFKSLVDEAFKDEADDETPAPAAEAPAAAAGATPAPDAASGGAEAAAGETPAPAAVPTEGGAAPAAETAAPAAPAPDAAPEAEGVKELLAGFKDELSGMFDAKLMPVVERLDALEGRKATTDAEVAAAITSRSAAHREVAGASHSQGGATLPPDVAQAMKDIVEGPGPTDTDPAESMLDLLPRKQGAAAG